MASKSVAMRLTLFVLDRVCDVGSSIDDDPQHAFSRDRRKANLVKLIAKLAIGVIMVVTLVGFGVFLAGGPLSAMLPQQSPTAQPTQQTWEAVMDVVPEEQVVLLSLGIEGLEERSQDQKKIFGWKVPGSERVMFVGYSFNAKLGFEGRDVSVERLAEKKIRITVPEFVFIGHDAIEFRSAIEQNGVLSWTTPKIDQSDVSNEILSDDRKAKYVLEYQEVLRDQTQNHFTTLVESIDPEIALEFEFN